MEIHPVVAAAIGDDTTFSVGVVVLIVTMAIALAEARIKVAHTLERVTKLETRQDAMTANHTSFDGRLIRVETQLGSILDYASKTYALVQASATPHKAAS